MKRITPSLINVKWPLAIVALLTLMTSAAVQAHGTTTTAIPFKDAGYRYQIVAYGDGAGFEAAGFDDSGWAFGAAGFGTQTQTPPGTCRWNNPTDVQTVWTGSSDLLVRRSFTLPPGAHNLRVSGTVDNDATVYINGMQIGSVASGFCISPNINFLAPDNLLVAGSNVLAVRASDFGAPSYLDLQVTFDDGPAYGVCPLYDQTKAHKAGSTVPIKLQLCDAAGNVLSFPDVVVHASGLTQLDGSASGAVESPGNANPDDDFRFDADLGGYIFNLSTDGLSSGTWQLTFTVDGEADATYAVLFDVR